MKNFEMCEFLHKDVMYSSYEGVNKLTKTFTLQGHELQKHSLTIYLPAASCKSHIFALFSIVLQPRLAT